MLTSPTADIYFVLPSTLKRIIYIIAREKSDKMTADGEMPSNGRRAAEEILNVTSNGVDELKSSGPAAQLPDTKTFQYTIEQNVPNPAASYWHLCLQRFSFSSLSYLGSFPASESGEGEE
jgi:hypothetical protein